MENLDFLLDSYDYDLPQELIAQVPAQPVESAKLLVWTKGDSSIQDYHFFDLPDLLTSNDVLVCNNTKVFKARIPLNQTKIKRKSWEIRNVDGEIFVYQLNHDGRLECLVSDDKNFKPWAEVFLDEEKWISLTSDEYSEDWIIFSVKWIWIFDFLEIYGQMPLPPYIHYEKEKGKRYQTTFAQNLGSAAAPTASLHFSQKLLSDLHSKWVEINFTTLHVGLWTFKPVYEQDIRNHKIHREPIIIENSLFQQIYDRKIGNKNLIAVWTTMVRLLETLPYLRTSLSYSDKQIILSDENLLKFIEEDKIKDILSLFSNGRFLALINKYIMDLFQKFQKNKFCLSPKSLNAVYKQIKENPEINNNLNEFKTLIKDVPDLTENIQEFLYYQFSCVVLKTRWF